MRGNAYLTLGVLTFGALSSSGRTTDWSAYFSKRDGMESARTALKDDRRGFQWLSFSACGGAWWTKGAITPYYELFQREIVAIWGGSPECRARGNHADLWWSQYSPGGRITSTHTVVFDSSCAAPAMKRDPAVAERQFETLIRQSIKFAPYQSHLIVHGDTPEFVAGYRAGREPECVRRIERLAAHYGFPTLNLAKAVADEGTQAVQVVVTAFVKDVLGRDAPINPRTVNTKLPEPKNAGICDQCHVVSYEDGSVRKIGSWGIGAESPRPTYMSVLAPGKAGDRIEMEFRGTEVGLVDFTCANGAEYAYRVDGGEWKTLRAEAALGKERFRERHVPFATGLAFSGKVSAKDDGDRHALEFKVVKEGGGSIVGFLLNGSTADEDAGADRPPQTLEDVDRIYAGMDKLAYSPPAGRHRFLPNTMRRLANGPSLNIVALGDSIIADMCRSRFELLLGRQAPKCRVSCVRSVRSATGCTWYKDDNRVDSWVFSHKPDLVIIGGVSNQDEAEAVRSVIRQIRAKDALVEIMVLTPVFGVEGNPKEHGWNVGWNYDPEKAAHPFRRELKRVAEEEKCAFFDINAPWRQYCLDSGKAMGYFHRDAVHANLRGQQLLGRLLESWFKQESQPAILPEGASNAESDEGEAR